MREIPLRVIIIGVIVIALVIFAVCKITGCTKSPEEKRLDAAIAADPNFSDYKANSEQVKLLGVFVDEELSSDESAYTYFVFELKGKENEKGSVGSVAINGQSGTSLVQLITLDDETDASDTLSDESARAFADYNILAAQYSLFNSVNGAELQSGTGATSIRVVAACTLDRTKLNEAENISIWFDAVDGLTNDGTCTQWPATEESEASTVGAQSGSIGYENVIMTIPASLATSVEYESDIYARFK